MYVWALELFLFVLYCNSRDNPAEFWVTATRREVALSKQKIILFRIHFYSTFRQLPVHLIIIHTDLWNSVTTTVRVKHASFTVCTNKDSKIIQVISIIR